MFSPRSPSPWTSRVSGVPSAQDRSSMRTHSGPPKGLAARRPGRPRATPSSPRWRSAALSRSDTRRTRKNAPGRRGQGCPTPRRAGRPWGMGSPCGSWVGWPSAASMRSSRRSEGRAPAPRLRRAPRPTADVENLVEERLQQPVTPDHLQGVAGAVRRERCAVVRGALDEPVLGEPLEHHGHGRRCDAQMAGECRRAHLVAPARQHEDGAQRVLRRGGGHQPAASP